MTVAGIFSSIGNNQVASSAASYGRSQMQRLGQDLATGNLSAAQSDYTTLRQAFAQSATTSSSSTTNPVTQAFQQLATDLKSGNLSAAQKDYTTLQQDLQNARQLHGHHHIKSGSGADENQLLQDLNQSGQRPSPPRLTSGGTNTVALHYAMPPIQENPISFTA
jgi:hypothetical protein